VARLNATGPDLGSALAVQMEAPQNVQPRASHEGR
jgi:hypothetical protein